MIHSCFPPRRRFLCVFVASAVLAFHGDGSFRGLAGEPPTTSEITEPPTTSEITEPPSQSEITEPPVGRVVAELVVTAVDEAVVAANVAGPIRERTVEEGSVVSAGDVLAIVDDEKPMVLRQLAEDSLKIALQKRDQSFGPEVARAKLAEERQLAKEHEASREANRRQATNDLRLQAAQKAEAVAKNELERARQARADFADAVSESEIEGLELEYDRRRLEALQAAFEMELAELELTVDEAVAQSLRLRVTSAELAVKQAESTRQVDAISAEIERRNAELAELLVEQHRVKSPIDGVVVELPTRLGDWVEPGQPVARILGVHRLRAEGFLDARDAEWARRSDDVTLTIHHPSDPAFDRPAVKVFVSPEIDPVTGEVRCWFEFDNPEGRVKPGMRASLRLRERRIADE